jgi:nucleoside-diphosphate-sugar epimerase
VTGAGGFIGGHLVSALVADGKSVRAVDVKPLDQWYQRVPGATDLVADVSLLEGARAAVAGGASEVYNLAADMGGMGFIENNKAACMLSVLTSTHMLQAANEVSADRFFYSSSACVYAAEKQVDAAVTALREEDAYPAMPEDGYGWEKLFSERLARHFREDFGLQTRIARFHNVYGPWGTWDGGREKAPAAACRKVAAAVLSGNHEIEIWGDGEQTRSFTYIDDCVHGVLMLTRSEFAEPINLVSSELVTINELYDLVADIAGVAITRRHVPGPLGVRGRNSDNTLIRRVFDWEPSTSLREGLTATYQWVFEQVKAKAEGRAFTN